MVRHRITTGSLFLLVAIATLAVFSQSATAENLRPLWLPSVRNLVFRAGENAVGRRSVFPQLECTGDPTGANAPKYRPSLVECRNVRSDGADVVWRCTGQTHRDVELDETIVVCEGFADAEDPYVTPGSCSLEYTLRYAKSASAFTMSDYVIIALGALSFAYALTQLPGRQDAISSEVVVEEVDRAGTKQTFDELWERQPRRRRASVEEAPRSKVAATTRAVDRKIIKDAAEAIRYGDDDALDGGDGSSDEDTISPFFHASRPRTEATDEPDDLFTAVTDSLPAVTPRFGFEFLGSLLADMMLASPSAADPSPSATATTASTRRRDEPVDETTTSTSTARTARRHEEPAEATTTSTSTARTARREEPTVQQDAPAATTTKTKRREEAEVTHETVTTETRTTRRIEHSPTTTASTSTARTKRR